MSAKVNMEAPPKEPDPAPSDPPVSSPKEDVLIPASDSVAKKARPQPHTTTAFLLQGELRARGGQRFAPWQMLTDSEPSSAFIFVTSW